MQVGDVFSVQPDGKSWPSGCCPARVSTIARQVIQRLVSVPDVVQVGFVICQSPGVWPVGGIDSVWVWPGNPQARVQVRVREPGVVHVGEIVTWTSCQSGKSWFSAGLPGRVVASNVLHVAQRCVSIAWLVHVGAVVSVQSPGVWPVGGNDSVWVWPGNPQARVQVR